MAEGKRLTVRDLELPAATPGSRGATLKEAREHLEKEMIQNALRKHGGRIAPAAVELGVGRPTLYDLMDKLGIPRE
jgi:two-component system NtrC family response regulator